VRALVFVLANGFAERPLQFANLGRYQLREPEQNGRGDAAPTKIFDDFAYVG
jgi:hypothetical protein